jgi:hypothetical protein
MERITEQLAEALDKSLISEAMLLSNCNPESPFYGHIALICNYWPNEQFTLHKVAHSLQELLELIDAAHSKGAFFPQWFLETRRPLLEG